MAVIGPLKDRLEIPTNHSGITVYSVHNSCCITQEFWVVFVDKIKKKINRMIKHFYNHWNIIFKIVDFIITARKRCWIYFMKGACNFTKTRRLPYGYQQSQKYTSLLQKFCVMDNNLNTDCWFLYKNSLNFAQVNVSILNFALNENISSPCTSKTPTLDGLFIY